MGSTPLSTQERAIAATLLHTRYTEQCVDCSFASSMADCTADAMKTTRKTTPRANISTERGHAGCEQHNTSVEAAETLVEAPSASCVKQIDPGANTHKDGEHLQSRVNQKHLLGVNGLRDFSNPLVNAENPCVGLSEADLSVWEAFPKDSALAMRVRPVLPF